MYCSACQWDIDTAFHQISLLQRQVQYLQMKSGYTYVDPKISEPFTVGSLPEDSSQNPEIAEDGGHSGYADRALKQFSIEELLEKIDARSLQRIFREVDDSVLASVLYSLDSKKAVEKMRKSLSRNHFDRLIDDIKYGNTGWVNESREQLRKTIWQLDEMGQIVVAADEESIQRPDAVYELTSEEREERKRKQFEMLDKYREKLKKEEAERNEKIKLWMEKMGIEKLREQI